MSEDRYPDALIHTFLDGPTMMLRVIAQGQVWQWALALHEITTMEATLAAWKQATIVAQINAREAASLEDLRRQAEDPL